MQPRVLQSLEHLGAIRQSSVPLEQLATTFTMAQAGTAVDLSHFAVGRWDGTISIFSDNATPSNAPSPHGAVITTAVSIPADQGVQMLAWVAPNVFISSNDSESMILWSGSTDWQSVHATQTLSYDSTYGAANSASVSNLAGNTDTIYLVTGHENGYALLWTGPSDGTSLTFVKAIDLRSEHPVNPWKLQNIRGVQWFLSNSTSIQYVTGSENGEICVIDIPSGNILSRTVFNPSAQRGINAISSFGQLLLVANCSVGTSDKNLWYYSINSSDWSVTLRDSTNLIIDTSRPQVFNFDVTWGIYNGDIVFYSATEEGALWMGKASNTSLDLTGYVEPAVADLGAILTGGLNSLAFVAYNVSSFNLNSSSNDDPKRDPNRVMDSDGRCSAAPHG